MKTITINSNITLTASTETCRKAEEAKQYKNLMGWLLEVEEANREYGPESPYSLAEEESLRKQIEDIERFIGIR